MATTLPAATGEQRAPFSEPIVQAFASAQIRR
jgi:hypothetical protein